MVMGCQQKWTPCKIFSYFVVGRYHGWIFGWDLKQVSSLLNLIESKEIELKFESKLI